MKIRIQKNGFTLIELMITVAVMLIVTFIAIPSYNSMMDRKKVNDATAEIWSYVSIARSEAAVRSKKIYLLVNNASGMSLAIDQDDLSAASSVCVPTTGVNCELDVISSTSVGNIKLYTTNDEINLKTNIVQIGFDPFTSVAEVACSGGACSATDSFNVSIDGLDDSYCKKIKVGYLGQTNIYTGSMASNVCQ